MDGFRAGRTLIVYRRDDPLLPWLLEQAHAGVLSQEYVEYDEQSSAMKFRLAKEKP
jgi:hypothetical protein